MLIFHPVVLLFNLISCDMFQPVVIFKHYTTLFYLNKYVAGIKYIFFIPFFLLSPSNVIFYAIYN